MNIEARIDTSKGSTNNRARSPLRTPRNKKARAPNIATARNGTGHNTFEKQCQASFNSGRQNRATPQRPAGCLIGPSWQGQDQPAAADQRNEPKDQRGQADRDKARRCQNPERTSAECTFGVDDVESARERVLAAGGRIVMEKFTISQVGHLIAFEDPGGNPALAMQYDKSAE